MARRRHSIITSMIICKNGTSDQHFLVPPAYDFYSRQKRLQSRIQSKTVSDCSHGEVIRTSDLFQHQHMGNEEHTIQDLHDVLESYYKVARKRFVDNLRKQAGITSSSPGLIHHLHCSLQISSLS